MTQLNYQLIIPENKNDSSKNMYKHFNLKLEYVLRQGLIWIYVNERLQSIQLD